MSKEFYEICHDSFERLIDEKHLSQVEIAKHLGVSTKTVQRWFNRSSKKINTPHLVKLSTLFHVDKDILIKNEQTTRICPTNRILEELLTDSYYQKIRATDDWDGYIQMLACFKDSPLSTQQLMHLHYRLGVANLYIGQLRSAKAYLESALKVTEVMGDTEVAADIFAWLGIREELSANLPEAHRYIEKALKLANAFPRLESQTSILLLKGRIELSSELLDDAERSIRTGLKLSLINAKQNAIRIAVWYQYLAWVYLAKRDFTKARISLIRLLRHSRNAGWVRGEAAGKLGLGVIHVFNTKSTRGGENYFGAGKRSRNFTKARPIDSRLEQLEFIQQIVQGDFQAAGANVQVRMARTESSNLFYSFTILDALFLSKIHPANGEIQESLIDKAETVFKKNELTRALRTLRTLKEKEKISQEEFLQLYLF